MTTARPSGEIFTSVKPTKLKNSSSVSLGLSVAWVGRTESSSSKTTRPRIFMGDRFISANLAACNLEDKKRLFQVKIRFVYGGLVRVSDAKVFNRKERKEKHAEVAKENLSRNLVLLHCIIQTEKFPALQRDGHISIFPEEIVECAQAERRSFLAVSVGEEFINLQLAYLIGNSLAGSGGEHGGFAVSSGGIHRNCVL